MNLLPNNIQEERNITHSKFSSSVPNKIAGGHHFTTIYSLCKTAWQLAVSDLINWANTRPCIYSVIVLCNMYTSFVKGEEWCWN